MTYRNNNQSLIQNDTPMKRTFYILLLVTFSHLTLTAQWTQENDFGGEGRDGSFNFVINGTAYMGGGILSNDFWKLDNTTQTWQQLNTIANGRSRSFSAAAVANGKGYMICGDLFFGQVTDEVWEYDPTADSWTQKADFPKGVRVGMVVFTINNRIYAGGGANNLTNMGLGTVYNDFFEYIPATDTWVNLPDLPFKAAFASSFVIGNDAYITVGSPANGMYNKNLYKFDISTNTWTTKTSFIGGNRNGGVAFSINGKGYAGLGQLDFNSTYQDMYEYDPTNDSWTKIADFPHDTTGWATAFVLNNKAYIGTGAITTLEFTKKMYSFSSPTSSVEPIEGASIQAYPNPMTDELIIKNIAVGNTITLTDITGKAVYNTIVESETTHLNTAQLSAGIYILYTPQGNIKLVK